MSIWTVIIFTIWFKAHLELSRRGQYEVLHRYQAAIQLSRSINRDFGPVDICTLHSKEFVKELKRVHHGGRVTCRNGAQPVQTGHSMRMSVRNWFKRERWWVIVLAAHTIWISVSWMRPFGFDFFYIFTCWVWPSVVFALVVGSSLRSRLFFITIWVLPGVVILGCLKGKYI